MPSEPADNSLKAVTQSENEQIVFNERETLLSEEENPAVDKAREKFLLESITKQHCQVDKCHFDD